MPRVQPPDPDLSDRTRSCFRERERRSRPHFLLLPSAPSTHPSLPLAFRLRLTEKTEDKKFRTNTEAKHRMSQKAL